MDIYGVIILEFTRVINVIHFEYAGMSKQHRKFNKTLNFLLMKPHLEQGP